MNFFQQLFTSFFGMAWVTQSATKLEWTPVDVNNLIPATVLDIKTNFKEYHFCEVQVQNEYIPGSIQKGANVCEYEANGEYKTSTTFNVLTNPLGVTTGWKYSDSAVPQGAVKCNQGTNCYLGQSVYGDGICRELPGKIFSGQTQMIMVNNMKIYKCPFKLYLVET